MCYKPPVIPDQNSVNFVFDVSNLAKSKIEALEETLKKLKQIRYFEFLSLGNLILNIVRVNILNYERIRRMILDFEGVKQLAQVGENGFSQMMEEYEKTSAEIQEQVEAVVENLHSTKGSVIFCRVTTPSNQTQEVILNARGAYSRITVIQMGSKRYALVTEKPGVEFELWEQIARISPKNATRVRNKSRTLKIRQAKAFRDFLENRCPKLAMVE